MNQQDNQKLKKWCIQQYNNEIGIGIPDIEASSVTSKKVQLRDRDGELLQEYEKDYVVVKLASNQIDARESESSSSGNGKILILAFIVALIGFGILYETNELFRVYTNSILSGIFKTAPESKKETSNKEPIIQSTPQPSTYSQPKQQKIVDVRTGWCPGIAKEVFERDYLSKGWVVINSSSITRQNPHENYEPYDAQCTITTYVIER